MAVGVLDVLVGALIGALIDGLVSGLVGSTLFHVVVFALQQLHRCEYQVGRVSVRDSRGPVLVWAVRSDP